MDKARLLETLQTEHARWEALLRDISADRMTQPGVEGEWSIKDIIAHVTFYEQWVASWLEKSLRGELSIRSDIDKLEMHQRNARVFEQNRNRSLQDVRAESQRVFERLLQVINELSDQDLADSQRFEKFVAPFWPERPALWECIAGDSYEHYGEHIPPIRAWLERHKAGLEIKELII